MSFITRESIAQLANTARQFEKVEAAGGTWHVARMTLGDRDELESQVSADARKAGKANTLFRAVLLSICLVDEKGEKRLFTQADTGFLARLPAECEPVIDAALRINGLRPEDREAAQKNSQTTPSNDSSTTSAKNGAAPDESYSTG